MHFPLVYIILLNYNNYQDTIECFDSLQNITYQNYKIVIIDNNSPNNSISYLLKYIEDSSQKYIYYKSKGEAFSSTSSSKFITLIQSEHNGGYGFGNNIGIKYALKNDADYVLILNNDTIVDKHFLEPLVAKCENDDKIGISSGKIYFYDKPDTLWFNGGNFNPWTASVKHFNFKEKYVGQKPPSKITFISGCLMLIPKIVLKTVGVFNEEYFMYFEDMEYCSRTIKNGYRLDITSRSKIEHKKEYNSCNRLAPRVVFYTTRNKLKFIINNHNFISKVTSILYIFIITSFRYLYIRRYDLFKAHIKGIFYSEYK